MGDFTAGAFRIPIDKLNLQVPTGLPGSPIYPVLSLSSEAQTRLSASSNKDYGQILTLRYHLSGGNAPLQPGGHNTTTLIFATSAL